MPLHHPCLQTSYPSSAHSQLLLLHLPHPLMLLAALLHLQLPLLSLTHSGIFNEMPKIFKLETLNFSTLSRSILWTVSVSRNLNSTRLSLSKFLDTLLCNLIALTPGMAAFFLITRTPAMVSSFLSCRDHFSLNFLHPLPLRLTPTLIV